MLSECKFGSKIGARNGESGSLHEKLDPTSDLVKELNESVRIYDYSIIVFSVSEPDPLGCSSSAADSTAPAPRPTTGTTTALIVGTPTSAAFILG